MTSPSKLINKVSIGGVVAVPTKWETKRGHPAMDLVLEHGEQEIEVVCFGELAENFSDRFPEGSKVLIHGKLGNGGKVVANKCIKLGS